MAAEPGRPGRRRWCGSRGSPPPAANSSAHPEARCATAPAGDRTACPAGTHRVSAVNSPPTASPDAPAILRSPRTSVRSLINFPGITAIASGEQAGSGPARPHLLVNAICEPGARVLAPATAPVITQCPPERRHRARTAPPSLLGTAGDLSAAGALPSGSLVICQAAAGPTPAMLRPRCARLPAPAGLSPRRAGRHLLPSRSGRRRDPSRPRTRAHGRGNPRGIQIRAPAAASASRPNCPGCVVKVEIA